MKKRIKLKGWVLVVLRILLILDILFMSCEAESFYVLFLKTIIGIIICLPILYLIIKYGDLK